MVPGAKVAVKNPDRGWETSAVTGPQIDARTSAIRPNLIGELRFGWSAAIACAGAGAFFGMGSVWTFDREVRPS